MNKHHKAANAVRARMPIPPFAVGRLLGKKGRYEDGVKYAGHQVTGFRFPFVTPLGPAGSGRGY